MPAYNDRVRRHFAAPVHAGDLPAGYPRVSAAATEGGESGCEVVLAAEFDGARLGRMRFRVFGCPHLIAAAEELCRRCEGRDPAVLGSIDAGSLAAMLEVPVEKTGRIFVLEDALRGLAAAVRREQTAGGSDRKD